MFLLRGVFVVSHFLLSSQWCLYPWRGHRIWQTRQNSIFQCVMNPISANPGWWTGTALFAVNVLAWSIIPIRKKACAVIFREIMTALCFLHLFEDCKIRLKCFHCLEAYLCIIDWHTALKFRAWENRWQARWLAGSEWNMQGSRGSRNSIT